jgi:prophage DNA circulation protein
MAEPRVRGTIQLTSPLGNEYTAKWIGNARSGEKKLGIYNYPLLNGTVVDDFGSDGDVYPLNLIFDGEGYDQVASRFIDSCRNESGRWEIVHPTKGFKGVKLVKWKENDEPVRSKGQLIVETTWIEDLDPSTLKTAAQLAAEAGALLNAFNDVSLTRFVNKAKTGSFGERLGITSVAEAVTTASDKILGPIAAQNAETAKRFEDINRGIQQTLDAAILNPLKLAGQLQATMQLPAEAIADTQARLAAYRDLATEIFGLTDDGTDNESVNRSLTKELSLSGIIGALSTIAVTSISASGTGSIQTQAQAIETLDEIGLLFSDITNALEADQEKFKDNTLDEQYFAQTETYRSAFALVAASQKYLLEGFFDLKVEKRFVLLTARSPWEITITEYGSPGEDEENYKLFISSNKLKNNEIFILKPGTEVVIYV